VLQFDIKQFKERLTKAEEFFAMKKSQLVAPASKVTHDSIFGKYFDKLDTMLRKHLPKMWRNFKSLEIKSFGVPPPCF